MPYTFRLTTTIPASPEEIYQAWLDSLGHSEMTGAAATMSDEVGAEVSAWGGYISGRNLELIPGERIVQSWRTSEFTDEHEDSILTVVLQEVDDGTLLTLEHANVPDEQRSYEKSGWQSNYFEPMMVYFTERKQQAAEPPAPEARPESKVSPKRAAKKPARKAAKPPAKRSAKSARKTKRAVSPKSKRAAPRTKAAPKKSKSKGAARRTAAVRKPAKPAARKSGRGRRR